MSSVERDVVMVTSTVVRRLVFALMTLALAYGAAATAQEAPPALEGEVAYTVVAGDTLDGIGQAYDVQIACIMERNDLPSSGLIRPGDSLILSAECPRYDGTPRDISGVEGMYIVRRGDTLELIARRLDVSLISLMRANDINAGTLITPGMTLTIPLDAPPFGYYPPMLLAQTEAGRAYVVHPGDVLDLIAAYFDVDLACLIERNAVENPLRIVAGTVLMIPPDCPRYAGYSSAPDASRLRGLSVLPGTVLTPTAPESP
jgi:LysM repeat protein